MRPAGSPTTLAKRRGRAAALLAHGLSFSEVARRVQASVGAVSQWRRAWTSGGAGMGVGRCRNAGPSSATSARARTGRATRGPPSKNARRLGAPLAVLDASGWLRSPTRRRPWAPTGQTPILFYRDQHARLSARAPLTAAPKRQQLGLAGAFPPANCTARHGAACWRGLWRHVRGDVVLLGAHGAMPPGPAIAEVQRAYPRLPLEAFPADAPERHPVEQRWNDVKSPTANSRPRATRAIRRSLQAHTRRGRHSQATWRALMRAAERPSPRGEPFAYFGKIQ